MVYVSGEDASQYEVHAVRLEGRLFLDLFPDKEIRRRALARRGLLAADTYPSSCGQISDRTGSNWPRSMTKRSGGSASGGGSRSPS